MLLKILELFSCLSPKAYSGKSILRITLVKLEKIRILAMLQKEITK